MLRQKAIIIIDESVTGWQVTRKCAEVELSLGYALLQHSVLGPQTHRDFMKKKSHSYQVEEGKRNKIQFQSLISSINGKALPPSEGMRHVAKSIIFSIYYPLVLLFILTSDQ